MATFARVTAALVVLLVLGVALLWVFQRRLVFVPGGPPVRTAAQAVDGASAVRVDTEDGLALTVWFVPAAEPAAGRTVLVLPGNGGSREDRAPLARALRDEGFDVLLLDYRGYGDNPGSPTEDGLAADARAAYRFLVDERGVDPARLVLFGESIGASVAVRLARERPAGALVLRSPATSLTDVAARLCPFLPVPLLLRDHFPVLDVVGAVRVPVAVVAGSADDLVPATQSRAVAAAAHAPYIEVPGARHDDPELAWGPATVGAVVRVAG